jgi:hypothetical protein
VLTLCYLTSEHDVNLFLRYFMKKEIPFITVPERWRPYIGEHDPETRQYRKYGTDKDYRAWFSIISKICRKDGLLSPGGAAGYVGVSRAGLHKRLKEGRMTVFLFHTIRGSKIIKTRKILEDGSSPSSAFIPVSELKAWAAELEGKTVEELDKEIMGELDWKGKTLMAPSRRKWQRIVKEEIANKEKKKGTKK